MHPDKRLEHPLCGSIGDCKTPLPVATHGMPRGSNRRSKRSLLQVTDRKLTAWGLPGGRAKSSKPMWPADRIVFLNDVYFCARDTIRLLQHDGDMVCGLDFDRPKLEEVPGEVSQLFGRSIRYAPGLAIPTLGRASLAA